MSFISRGVISERRPHPSGRPIRKIERKGRPIWRIPDTESNVPRLRPGTEQTNAIGFIVGGYREPDHSDEE